MANKPPLVTGMDDFIASSRAKPATTIIGPGADLIAPAVKLQPAAPAEPKRKAKPAAQAPKAVPDYPWANCNPKISQFVQVRMPEALNVKLQWIKDNSVGVPSKHALILEAIETLVTQRIAELQAQQGRAGR